MIYPMQRSDEMFDALAGKKVFTSLDAARGYHQVPIKEEHRWKTAFLTHRGLFEYKTMPFGLKTAPALFQQFMDKVLGGLRWTAALCYIDDVIIFSDSVEEHAEHVRKILKSAIAVGLKFTPNKCHFAYASLTLLGRRVSTEGLEVLQDKLAAVRELKPPKTIKELWHVLGLFGYYRAFIHRYSIIAAPLTALTKGYSTKDNPPGAASKTTIQWSESCQTAFDTLKERLTNPPVLAYPDFMRPFTLYVDASHDGMACALHQEAAEMPVPVTSSYAVTSPFAERLIEAQHADPAWKRVLDNPQDFGAKFRLENGILYREDRICLPNDKTVQRDVFHDIHDANGHMGFSKSFDKLARQWYRTGMAAAIRNYIQGCEVCAGAKKSRQKQQGEMTIQRHMSNTPFDAISMDVFELPKCQGHDACLAISDLFTKSIILRPTRKTADAEEIAEILFNSVVCKGFLPSTIISDNDSKYTSRVWAKIMEKLGTRISLSSPYHQQADPVERSIQTAQTVLRCYGDTDWVSRLQYVELVLNEAKHESTGFSPNELLYTANRSPIEALRKPVNDETPELLAFARARIEEAREQIAIAQERQKGQYDNRHRRHDQLAVGDKAFLRLDLRPVPSLHRTKIDWPKWGPFEVLEISPDSNRVKLDFPKTHRLDWVSAQHVERLATDKFDRTPPEAEGIKEGEELWEVEKFMGEREYGRRRHRQFLVKWKHWPTNRATWEFEANLQEDMDKKALETMVDQYRREATATARAASANLEEAGTTAKAIPRGISTKNERPILYLSRTLRSYERNYTILELEMGAVVWSVLKLQRYLDGTPFTVVTDHQPIIQVVESSSKTITSPRVERWRMLLQPYVGQMSFVHKAGKLHANVDALSRLPRETDPGEGESRRRRDSGGGSDGNVFSEDGEVRFEGD
jgi:transposase InsO family protein